MAFTIIEMKAYLKHSQYGTDKSNTIFIGICESVWIIPVACSIHNSAKLCEKANINYIFKHIAYSLKKVFA